jgi:hypothetical protein
MKIAAAPIRRGFQRGERGDWQTKLSEEEVTKLRRFLYQMKTGRKG